jgi:hypothetical protein
MTKRVLALYLVEDPEQASHSFGKITHLKQRVNAKKWVKIKTKVVVMDVRHPIVHQQATQMTAIKSIHNKKANFIRLKWHMYMPFCMITGTNERSRFNIFKSTLQTFFFIHRKGIRMYKLGHFQMHFCGLQVLAQGENH